MEKEKLKLNVRKKKKTGVKTKIEKQKAQAMRKTSERSKLTLESEEVQHLLIGRPKTFKNPAELIKLFNTYLLTCLEKKRYYEIVPVTTVDTNGTTHAILEVANNEELTTEEDVTERKAGKKEAGRQDITNKLESRYEIKERVEWRTTPSIGGFLIFLGGVNYDTWESYAKNPEFSGTCKDISNYLESLIVEQTANGKYNSQFAQFILNVNYGRVPKSKSEQVIKGNIVNEEDFIQD